MLNIKTKDVVDDKGRIVAVQVETETFNKMIELLEDYALVQYIKEGDGEEHLSLEEAKAFYEKP